jgi:NAD(P)-dependent dehydrogenase (short-subunit alcohol dehydrogenase family)
MDEIRFDGRAAIVTGAGGGLGRSHALMLATRGAKILVNDLGVDERGEGESRSMADAVVDEIRAAGGEAVANYDSVDTWAGGEAIVRAAEDAFGRVDILINNAGILRDRTIPKMTEEEYRRVIDVHLNGGFFVTRAAFPIMREQGYGRIIFTSSGAGLWGNFGQANYSSAKLGVCGLMHVVKIEGAKRGIKANAIAPIAASRLLGTIMTERMMRSLDTRYVSLLVCYLASEACHWTGGIFAVGAGHYARAAMVEGPGVNLGEAADLTIETIRDRFDEICDLKGATEFFNSRDHIPKMAGDLFASEGSE